MDYKGDYFPEEHDENESKIYRTVKGIFKWTMYGISFVIYAIIFIILFINRESKILERNYMNEISDITIENTDDVKLYRINTIVFMNDLGSLQLHDVNYAEDYGLLEAGIQFNPKNLLDENDHHLLEEKYAKSSNYNGFLSYKLTDSNGNEYPLVNHVTDSGGRYGYARICFSGLKIDLDSNDLRYDENDSNKKRTAVSYYLIITRETDQKELFKFEIYNNKTTFSKTEYND